MAALLVFTLSIGVSDVQANEPAVPSAEQWLAEQQQEDGSFGSHARWRDAELAVRVLGGELADAPGLGSWMETATPNNDFLARRIRTEALLGSTEASSVAALLDEQYEDGGFGLSADYPSDVWDTVLALEALMASGADTAAQAEAVAYVLANQNEDGGWSTIDGAPSDAFMTSTVLEALGSYFDSALEEDGGSIQRASAWLQERFTAGSIDGDFTDTARACLALSICDQPFDTAVVSNWIASKRNADGSMGAGDVQDTALGIMALRATEANLALTSLDCSDHTPRVGQVVRISAAVLNLGPRRVNNVRVRMTVAGYDIGDVTLPRLDSGESTQVAVNYEIATAAGPAEVAAEVDPQDRVFETSESDNRSATMLSVRGALGAPVQVAPADGTWSVAASPLLLWSPPSGDVGQMLTYMLQVDRTPMFDSPLLRAEVIGSGTQDPVSFPVPSSDPLREGTWYWRVRVADDALIGPWSPARKLTVDSIAPRITGVTASPAVFSPNSDSVLDTCTVRFAISEATSTTAELVDAGGQTLGVLLPATHQESGIAAFDWRGELAPSDGLYRIKIRCEDAAGNYATVTSDPVRVDRTAPVLTNVTGTLGAISPNGDGIKDTTTVSWSVSGDVTTTVKVTGPSGVIRVDQTKAAAYVWNGKNAYNQTAADGSYSISIRCEDEAGNSTAESSFPVTVKTACDVGAVRLEPPVVRPGEQVRILVPVHDDATVTVNVLGQTLGLQGSVDRSVLITAPAAQGNYPVAAEARDSLGNITRPTPTALVVRSTTVAGPAWVQDTQAEFRTTNQASFSSVASTTIDARAGSVELAKGGWSLIGDMPDPRIESANCLGPDGKLYVIGGWWENTWSSYQFSPVQKASAYDPSTGQWEELAPPPTKRRAARAVFAPDGKIYVIGGEVVSGYFPNYSRTPTGCVEAYDPATNTWESDTNNGGALAPMPTSRTVFGAALGGDGKIYCVGGYTGPLHDGGSTTAHEVYDPVANSWQARSPMPQPECCFASTGMDGKVYVLEGEYRRNSPTGSTSSNLSNAWCYHPLTDSWQARAASPLARTDTLSARALDGRLYVYGGGDPNNVSNRSTAGYDPVADDWIRAGDLVQGVEMQTGVADSLGRPYAIGGALVDAFGDILTRSKVQRLDPNFASSGTFTSAVKYFGSPVSFGAISWDAVVPSGTTVTLATRSSLDGVEWSQWSDEYLASGSSVLSPNGAYVQYRIKMTSDNPVVTPRVDRVSIVYNLAPSSPTLNNRLYATGRPSLSWTAASDPEGDAVSYDLQLDTTAGFASPQLRSYGDVSPASASSPAMNVPAADTLPDGVWHMRVRSTDGRSKSAWKSATVTIDTTAPRVTVTGIEPAVASAPAYAYPVSRVSYSADETSTVNVRVEKRDDKTGTWMGVWSEDVLGVTPGSRDYIWNGTDWSAKVVAPGTYRFALEGRDTLGNTSPKAYREFVLRRRPSLVSASVSSDVRDAGQMPLLEFVVDGSCTKIEASADGESLAFVDADGDGKFTGEIPASASGQVELEAISLVDAVAGSRTTVPSAMLEVPAVFGADYWTESTQADFADGVYVDATASAGAVAVVPSMWANDPLTLSRSRYDMASAQVSSKLYLAGGYPFAEAGRLVEVLDLQNGGRTALPSLNTGRYRAAAAATPGGDVYVMGGGGASGSPTSIEVLRAGASGWTQLAPMPVGRLGAASFVDDGRVFVIGGLASTSETRTVQSFDTATMTWTNRAPMPVRVADAAGCYLDGKYYLFGGADSSGSVAALQIYDVASDSWSRGPDVPFKDSKYCAVTSGGAVYLYGSVRWSGSEWVAAAWRFDPETGSYSPIPLPLKRSRMSAAAEFEGRIFLAGGYVQTAGAATDRVEALTVSKTGLYDSSVYDAGEVVKWGRVGWSSYAPSGAAVTLQTRSSLDGVTWTGWSDPVPTAASVPSPPGRFLQYRALLRQGGLDRLPTLGDVAVEVIRPAVPTFVPPAPLSPCGDVTNAAPSLTWLNSVGGMIRQYEVQVDRLPSFDTPDSRNYDGIGESAGTSALYIATANPLAEGDWFWRVRATDGYDVSEWSSPAAFTVVTLPQLSVSAPSSLGAHQAQTTILPVTVHNEGIATTRVPVRVIDTTSGSVISEKTIASIGHGGRVSLDFDLDTSAWTDARRVRVEVDPGNRIAESDELDNSAESEIVVTPHGISAALEAPASAGAEETVTVTLTATNEGAQARDLMVTLLLEDESGTGGSELLTRTVTATAGSAASVVATFCTEDLYAGDYRLRLELRENNRLLAADSAAFELVPDMSVDGRVWVQHLAYGANEDVRVTSRVTNTSANVIHEGLSVRTSILSPEGTQLATSTASVASLMRGESKAYSMSWNTEVAAPGAYSVVEEIVGSDGEVLATHRARFTIEPTTLSGVGLTGGVSTSSESIHWSESVTLSYSVANAGNVDIAGLPLRVYVVDPEDTSTALAAFEDNVQLAMGESAAGSFSLNTTSLEPLSRTQDLLCVVGVEVDDGFLPLGHCVVRVHPVSLGAAVMTDSDAYDCTTPVKLTAEVSNATTGFAVQGVTAVLKVEDAQGEVVFSETRLVEALASGETSSVVFDWNTATEPPGEYRVAFEAVLVGHTASSADATFTVASTNRTGCGLSGALVAVPEVYAGDPIEVGATLSNAGNADVEGMPAVITLRDKMTGESLSVEERSLSVGLGSSIQESLIFDTSALEQAGMSDARALEVVFEIQPPDASARELDRVDVTVVPGLRAEVSASFGDAPRVLAWCDTAPNRDIAAQALAASGLHHSIVATSGEFIAEMRSGVYDTYLLLDVKQPLTAHLDEEFAERVYSGDALIASRLANMDDLKQQRMFGVKFAGFLSPAARSLSVPETRWTPALTAAVAGKVQRVTAEGASVLARFGTDPAITVNRHGRGTAMLATFDIASAPKPLAVQLLSKAVSGCEREAVQTDAGDVRMISIEVTNTGVPATLVVDTSFAGGKIVSAQGASDTTASGATWRLEMARDEAATLTLLVRNGDGSMPLTAHVTVAAERAGSRTVLAQAALTAEVRTVASVTAGARSEIALVRPPTKAAEAALAKAARALAALTLEESTSDELDAAVRSLVLAAGDLESAGPQATSARLATDEVLRAYESMLHEVSVTNGEATL